MKKTIIISLLFIGYACENKRSKATENQSSQKNTSDHAFYSESIRDTIFCNDIGGRVTGWELEIDISNNRMIARGDGYQMGFLDELNFEQSNEDEIHLKYKRNISGYNLGHKMEPEFILKKINEKIYIDSEWISNDVTNKKTKKGYLIEGIY